MFDKLPYFNKEKGVEIEVEEEPEYDVFRLEPDDDVYEQHVDYLEREKGMDIDRQYPVVHISGDRDTSIYAGPDAEQLLEEYELPRT